MEWFRAVIAFFGCFLIGGVVLDGNNSASRARQDEDYAMRRWEAECKASVDIKVIDGSNSAENQAEKGTTVYV